MSDKKLPIALSNEHPFTDPGGLESPFGRLQVRYGLGGLLFQLRLPRRQVLPDTLQQRLVLLELLQRLQQTSLNGQTARERRLIQGVSQRRVRSDLLQLKIFSTTGL